MRTKRIVLIASLILSLLVTGLSAAPGEATATAYVEPGLLNGAGDTLSLIVTASDSATAARAVERLGGQISSTLWVIDAVAARRSEAIRRLQELAAPEQKVERVHVTQVLGSVLETPEDVEEAIERLKEHLLKILAEGSRIVLE